MTHIFLGSLIGMAGFSLLIIGAMLILSEITVDLPFKVRTINMVCDANGNPINIVESRPEVHVQ